MSNVIKIKKGLDINLAGAAERRITTLGVSQDYSLSPLDFEGVTPKLLVAEGEQVEVGQPLFFDKNHPSVQFSSPVSGTVSAVERGEKRKILAIRLTADGRQTSRNFDTSKASSSEGVKSLLLESGLWPMIIQRPYGIIANPDDKPKAIFVSAFDSAPLAPDLDFAMADQKKALQAGFDALARLTDGKVHLGVRNGSTGVFTTIERVERHLFEGPHPAGNVGVQIHHIDPVSKGETVWTVAAQNVAIIGRLMLTGRVDMTKTIAVTGSMTVVPQYIRCLVGSSMVDMLLHPRVRPVASSSAFRLIRGNVLTGCKVGADSALDYYSQQITIIHEGGEEEFMGWIRPRLDRLSVSHAYFSWLTPRKVYDLDTNLNGGPRPFVVSGLYEKYLPMDIYPVYLFKAIMAGDIEKMENLGIYEVIEEDVALCEFVDPSKIEIQQLVRDGIRLMIKEM